jgi:hypothetical protein
MPRKTKRKLARLAAHYLDGNRLQLVALSAGAGLVAERLAFNALSRGWRAVRGDDPPSDPEHPDVEWKEALAWAALSGVTMALVGLAARRGAAAGFKRAHARFA